MFSPKVLYAEPWRERILITLLVSGEVGVWSGPGSWVETMYCSLSTSWHTHISHRVKESNLQ